MNKLKILQLVILLFVPGLLFSCEKTLPEIDNEKREQTEKTYFINTQDDFDKWSNFNFPAGSKVLFATGKSFKGQFILRGSGTENSPNLATAYNSKTGAIYTDWTDNKSLIQGEGTVSSALKLSDGSFWEINNIEVTNTNGTKNQQGKILGINVVATDAGLVRDITVKNCYVHDVNGDVGGKETGGIHVYVLGEKVKTKFQKLTIEANLISYVGGVGIANQSSWGNIDDPDYHPWTEFAIRNNRVEHTERNGIIVRYAQNPIVEYNIVAYSSRFSTGHSIFNFNTVDCIVQYNEAYGNTSNNPDDIDHGGFDADYNSRGTIIQYNYSHDNNWFCGIMRKPVNTDITIRYNISQNELLGAFLYGFPTQKGVKGVKIYNNTLYFAKGTGKRVFVEAGKFRTPTETIFANNIFCFEDKAIWGFEPDETCVFENNLYFNVSPRGKYAITTDPLFVSPGTGGTDIDMTDPDRLSGYRLKEGSPAINKGKIIEENGGMDFIGNPIQDKPDIGAFEKTKNNYSGMNRYSEPVFDEVNIQKDIQFGEVINHEGNKEKLLLDVYEPSGDIENNRPVILWLHGGGFRKEQDKTQSYIVRMANEFAKRGYVCISINYRVRNNPKDDKTGTLTDALHDAMLGLNWIRDNHEKLKIDKSKIIVGGGSAGGRLAANLCYLDSFNSKKWDKSGIIAQINLWGTPDESWTLFEIDKNDSPTVIVHGTEDKLVPYINSIEIVNQLKKSNVKHKLITLEGEGHTPVKYLEEFAVEVAHFLYHIINTD